MTYEQQIKKIISERSGLDIHEISPQSYFEDDLNIGNIELLEIITDIEETLGVEIPGGTKKIETVEDILTAVSEQLE
ncbi:acyl carrier protein [candidate division WWE3 bacterium]|nr:acyl carrier protein [candidate division WWE3 bacterium]